MTCAFPLCERGAYTSRTDLCRAHWYQAKTGIDLRPIETRDGTPPPGCDFPRCSRPSASRGLCQSHGRQRDAGKPLKPLRPLSVCPSCPHPPKTACLFPKCKWQGVSHGLCPGHAWQRDRGRKLTPLPIKTPRGASTKAEQSRRKQHRRRSRSESADLKVVTTRDWDRLVARYGGLCAYCRTRPWSHQDHVIPIARGGRFAIGNLLPACASCNGSKGSKLLVEWRHA